MDGEKKKLSRLLNGYVTVKISENRTINGVLKAYDEHMNIVLKDVEDIIISDGEQYTKEHGLITLRGNNIISIEAIALPDIPIKIDQHSRITPGVGVVRAFGRGYV